MLKFLILLSSNNTSNYESDAIWVPYVSAIESGEKGGELLARVHKLWGEYQVHECGSHNRRAPPTRRILLLVCIVNFIIAVRCVNRLDSADTCAHKLYLTRADFG